MKEVQDIITAYEKAINNGKACALATVVHVEGSSYRRPGARMLVTDDGMITGAVSGGCLEGDALRKALFAIAAKQNKLVTYDTTDEDDAKFGVQLGCNGIVHILFEPIQIDDIHNPVELLKTILAKRINATLVTVFSLINKEQTGTCFVDIEGVKKIALKSFEQLDTVLKEKIIIDVDAAFQKRSALINIYQEGLQTNHVFIQYLSPPVSLLIIGAGNDVFPVVSIAQILGWDITIVDGRPTHATKQRFATVKNIIVSPPENLLQKLIIDQWTVAILMTHNYNYDLTALKQFAKTNLLYLGVLGPKLKMQRMYNDLLKEGFEISIAERSKIYAPVGLDIGAETAEEIALSIVTEIKAVLMGKDATILRDKKLPIHQ